MVSEDPRLRERQHNFPCRSREAMPYRWYFEADADWLASTTLAGREVDKLYLSQLGAAATRDAVLQSFDDGASIVSYLGHGSINLWADETIFHNNDMPLLAPQSQQPFVLTMNCLNGFFTLPFFDALCREARYRRGPWSHRHFLAFRAQLERARQALPQVHARSPHLRGASPLGRRCPRRSGGLRRDGSFPRAARHLPPLRDPALLVR